jgi:hypothetical protein
LKQLRFGGRANGQGAFIEIDSLAAREFAFRFLPDGAGCLVRKSLLWKQGDTPTEFQAIANLAQTCRPPGARVDIFTDICFVREQAAAITAASPPREPGFIDASKLRRPSEPEMVGVTPLSPPGTVPEDEAQFIRDQPGDQKQRAKPYAEKYGYPTEEARARVKLVMGPMKRGPK